MDDTAPFNLLMLIVVPAAIALGIWMGVRKHRELDRIARDILAGGNEEALAALRREVTRAPVRVRLFFRILGFIVGPLSLLGGLASIAMTVSSLAQNGFRTWWLDNWSLVLTGILSFVVGVVITRASLTGYDRYLR